VNTGRLLAVAVTLFSLALGGCADYQLRGRVIAGEASYIAVVDADDPALREGRGIGGATIAIATDPDRISRKEAGTSVSLPDGSFATPFTEPGGGFLLYDVGVRVSRSGYLPAEAFLELPSGSKRLLVVLAPGRAPATADEDPYEQYKRFRR
jgi:hypothetical protein